MLRECKPLLRSGKKFGPGLEAHFNLEECLGLLTNPDIKADLPFKVRGGIFLIPFFKFPVAVQVMIVHFFLL